MDQIQKSVGKFARRKHKKVEQALGLSLRNLFEQLDWRTSSAAVRAYKQCIGACKYASKRLKADVAAQPKGCSVCFVLVILY